MSINGGKVYHNLDNKINNNLIKIIHLYLLPENQNCITRRKHLIELFEKTDWINCHLDNTLLRTRKIKNIGTYWTIR